MGDSKSCELDLMSTSLVKDLLHVLVPPFHKIVNRSLLESNMPKGSYDEAASEKTVP